MRREYKPLFFNKNLKWHFAFFAIGTNKFYEREKRKLLVYVQAAVVTECSFNSRNSACTPGFKTKDKRRTLQ